MTIDTALALIAQVRDVIADTPTRRTALEFAGRKAGVVAEQLAGGYPEPSRRPLTVFYDRVSVTTGRAFKSKFKSLKQQRFVMRLAAQGKIPYTRTGLLGRSITSDAISNGDGVVINVGTNDQKAKYVIGLLDQSHYHMGTWPVLVETITRGKAQIVGAFETALTGWLRGYLAGGGK